MGSLARWDDERGFGFIQPNDGGQQVFVHVTAFRGLDGRPAAGDVVVFDVVTGQDGRSQAREVQCVDRMATRPERQPGRGRRQPLALFPVAMLAGYLGVAVAAWRVPLWVPGAYIAMGMLSFALYAADKRRARSGHWRIPEATLQAAGLACGWPGAVIAQQLLRHKNRKRSFQLLFWILAGLNSIALAVLVHQTRLRG